MSKPYTLTYQNCDLCKIEYGVTTPLPDIDLPGYRYGVNGRCPTFCKASICKACEKKLRDIIEKYLVVEEIEYAGERFEWKEVVE